MPVQSDTPRGSIAVPAAAARPPGSPQRAAAAPAPRATPPPQPAEHGGPAGPEPTRFGDWERAGRCIDF